MASMDYSKNYTLQVEKPASGGQGVARHEGMAVFVQGGLPGDLVEARMTNFSKRFANAVVVRVIEPSSQRIVPACPHAPALAPDPDSCGGCPWMELDYGAQLHWKRILVQDALERVGKFSHIQAEPVLPSPKTQWFRNKMEFAFSPGAPTLLGLRQRGSHGVLDIQTCLLQTPETIGIITAARDYCRAGQTAAYDPSSRQGLWRHLVVRSNEQNEHLVQILVATDKNQAGLAQGLAETLLGRPEVVGAVVDLRRAPEMIAQGETRALSLGKARLTEELDGVQYAISPQAFFQTNTRAAELLYGLVRGMAGLTGGETVWDLYCGNGGISLFLARYAASVLGLEANSLAVKDAALNAQANGLDHCRFMTVNLNKGLPRLSGCPDVLVTDPPRAGMSKRLAQDILRLGPRRIVSVSCDPATHARDLALLAKEYRLLRVQPVDMFPHTPHVESAALLERR